MFVLPIFRVPCDTFIPKKPYLSTFNNNCLHYEIHLEYFAFISI